MAPSVRGDESLFHSSGRSERGLMLMLMLMLVDSSKGIPGYHTENSKQRVQGTDSGDTRGIWRHSSNSGVHCFVSFCFQTTTMTTKGGVMQNLV